MSRRGAGFLFALGLLAPGPVFGTDVGAEIAADLRLRPLESSLDEAALRRFYEDKDNPPRARARALYVSLADKPPPFDAADRLRVLAALTDPASEVRAAALRALGHARERVLEGEALKRLAEDTESEVRVEALRAVRPWSRQGHLYFLQQALFSRDPWVQAETLINLGAIHVREIPLEMLSAVETASGPTQPSEVRLRAFQALRGWGKLAWPPVRDLLVGDESSEALRLMAVEAADTLAPPEEKGPILLALLSGDASPRLAWEAFQRLRRGNPDESSFLKKVGRYLSFSEKRNSATEEMAALLRSRGYRVEYRSGAWKVGSAR